MEPAPSSAIDLHEMQGRAQVRRVGWVRFPVFELVQDDVVLASMGRIGLIKVFFGRGQRLELADGSRWRLKAFGSGGAICPAIVDDGKRMIALSSLVTGGYGLNGKAFGLTLYAAEKKRLSRQNHWILRHYDDEVATVKRYPSTIDASTPVHLGAVLLAFTLARYGILGEWRPEFKFRWG